MSIPKTLDDLADLSRPELVGWVRDVVLRWLGARDDKERVAAFFPALVSRNASDPATALARELRAAFRAQPSRIATAAALALEGWSPLTEGAKGAAFLNRLAAALGASELPAALAALAVKSDTRRLMPSIQLSSSYVNALKERLTPAEAVGLATRARAARLVSDDDAIRLVGYLAVGTGATVGHMLEKLRLSQSKLSPRLVRRLRLSLEDYSIEAGIAENGEDLGWLADPEPADDEDAPPALAERDTVPKRRDQSEDINRLMLQTMTQMFPTHDPADYLGSETPDSTLTTRSDIPPYLDTTDRLNVVDLTEHRKRGGRSKGAGHG